MSSWTEINEPAEEIKSAGENDSICEHLANIEEMLGKIIEHLSQKANADEEEVVIGYHERQPVK